MLQLTIRRPGSLLSIVAAEEITEEQAEIILGVIRATEGLNGTAIDRLAGNINLTLMTLGNGVDPWDAPEGAGESVEAFRG